MARRKRRPKAKPLCGTCGVSESRRGQHTKLCAECYRKQGRPKAVCSLCSKEFAADVMVGRRCRACISALNHGKRVQEVYGITAEQYAELLAAQDGRCWICQVKPSAKALRLAVDHNHETGEVRGLLCKRCNRNLLGAAHDSTELLERAIQYLTDPPARRVLNKGA